MQGREVMCLWGENDSIVPAMNRAHVRETIPHCTINVISGAGHEITVGDCGQDSPVARELHDFVVNFCYQQTQTDGSRSARSTPSTTSVASGDNDDQPDDDRDFRSLMADSQTPNT